MTSTPPERLLTALADRLHDEDVSIRTKMLEAAGKLDDVILMGRGDPDLHTPLHIAEAAKRAIDDNEHHYTHPTGIPRLREAIATSLADEYALAYDMDEIVVTAGVQESVTLCMLALVNPGDEVLITSPRFTSYDTAVHLAGGVPVPVPTYERDGFALMPSEIESRLTPRSKILVLVTPNNPTGAVTPPDAIKEIADLAVKHDLIVISDEIYAKLLYEGHEHLSIATLPGMKARTITLNGFSKSYAMTGWRVGYLAAPREFVRAVTEVRHTLSINTATPSQFAALAALEGPQEPVEEMVAEYARRREFMMTAFDDMGLTYGPPGGAFYLYVNVTSSGLGAEEFCMRLLEEARVMVFPGSLFGDDSDAYMRIGYLQPMPKIKEAAERINRFVASLRQQR